MSEKIAQVIDITESTKQYIIRTIKEKHTDMDLSEGSPFVDMFVDPISPVIAPLVDLIGRIELKTNLNNAELMTEEELDEVAEGNYFFQRKQGGKSYGEVTFYLRSISEENNFVIPQGVILSTDDGYKYQVISRHEFTPNDLYPMYNPENLMYEITVSVEGIDVGIEYDVEEGKIKNIDTPFSEKVVSVGNINKITGGESKESNGEFAERLKSFYISRNLGTSPGYKDFIIDNFQEVEEMHVSGKNDAFMMRDIITYKNEYDELVSKHIGGKIDIYIRGETFDTDVKSIVVQNNIFELSQNEINETSIQMYLKGDIDKTPRVFSLEYDSELDIYTLTASEYSDGESLIVEYEYGEGLTIYYDEFKIEETIVDLEAPISGIISIFNNANETEIDISEEGAYEIISKNPEFDSTSQEEKSIKITSPFVKNGNECKIEYSYSRTLNLLEKIFSLEESRIITTDVLFKKAIPIPINIIVEIGTKGEALTASHRSTIQRSIASFLSDIKMGGNIEESDIVANLYKDENVADFLRYIKLPLLSIYVPVSISADIETGRRDIGTITSRKIEYFSLNKIQIIEL